VHGRVRAPLHRSQNVPRHTRVRRHPSWIASGAEAPQGISTIRRDSGSIKELGSKPCFNSMVVTNFSKNLKPCRLNKPNTRHDKI
jgi:hypothetical protein